MMSLHELPLRRLTKHQLNNEGCLCQLCQKINIDDNKIIRHQAVTDRESEGCHTGQHRQHYLGLIDEFVEWEKKPRKIRFCLPEICVFDGGHPIYWVSKPRQAFPLKLTRNKLKMNMFQIQHFFLEGYILHNPSFINKRREYHSFKSKSNQCIIAAKYQKNVTQLLTLEQVEGFFKSKFKHMRDGLLYLQTVVGGRHGKEISLRIDLEEMEKTEGELVSRAKQEVRMVIQEVKVTHGEYYPESEEMRFERELKQESMKRFLTYQSLKMIFLSSRYNQTIMRQTIFRWCYIQGGGEYLWDVRVQSQVASGPYWQSSVMQALQIKLKKTMSMMELTPQNSKIKVTEQNLSPKARQMQLWLQRSTEQEWKEIVNIRSRLQLLEQQKKKLIESQKMGHLNIMHKTFRLRKHVKPSKNKPKNNQNFDLSMILNPQ